MSTISVFYPRMMIGFELLAAGWFGDGLNTYENIQKLNKEDAQLGS